MVIIALGVISFGLIVWNLALANQMKSFRRSWSSLVKDVDGINLEQLVKEELKQNVQIETDIDLLKKRLDTVEDRLRASKRYVGLVRYDAFGDVGGAQSFAMAVYDDDGNGAVITSQVGRSDCRVYGKSLYNGKSEMSLTVEEQRAIEQAASPKSRPRIST